ncbi:SAF domain-containing protein [Isoptericola aurantiacus]|uniref:SAF domain-containing protein n=1 Tax=Isoptericola aurantiacus TaxID=3377839 RepID=UPI00383B3DBC
MESTGTSRLLRRLRSAVWRSRFVLAAVCCGLAASVTVDALRPPAPPSRQVVVTARDVPAGTTLAAADVTTVSVAVELAPDDVLGDPGDVVGRTSAVPLPAGLPLHPGLVPGGGPASRAPEGSVVVAVRLAETSWLRPGDHVDLLAADDDGTRLARRALVLPGVGSDAGGGAGGLLDGAAPTGTDSPVTLVAVDPDEAAAVSSASGWGAVVAVLVP